MPGIEYAALRLIDDALRPAGLSLADNFADLPQPPAIARVDPVEAEIQRWRSSTTDEPAPGELTLAQQAELLNPSQRIVFETIMERVTASIANSTLATTAAAAADGDGMDTSNGIEIPPIPPTLPPLGHGGIHQRPPLPSNINDPTSSVRRSPSGYNNLFFIDAPGGYGKTFVIKLLLASVRASGHVAKPVASSGIAALLMEGGTTAHSLFSIPCTGLTDDSCCPIKQQSHKAKLIIAAHLIIWDEAPMTDKRAYGAVDRALRSLMGTPDLPFGGKVFVMAGDFRQVLPVVPRGNRASIVGACIKRYQLWNHVTVLRLDTNMRVQLLLESLGHDAAAAQEAFARFLLAVGEGLGSDPRRPLLIPQSMVVPGESPEDLIRDIFGDLSNNPHDREETRLMGRCILSPKNNDVIAINDMVTDMLPSQVSGPTTNN